MYKKPELYPVLICVIKAMKSGKNLFCSVDLLNVVVPPKSIVLLKNIEALKNSRYKLYWIGVGKDDFLYQSVVTLRKLLDKHNFKYVYRESTGGHTWTNWRIYLSEFAPLLFK